MLKKGRSVASLFLTSLILITLVSPSTVFAGTLRHGEEPAGGGDSVTNIEMRLKNATIPWAFPAPNTSMTSTCPDIPAGISINPDDFGSDRTIRATIKTKADGTKQIVVVDTIVGKAHDNSGGNYKFNYYNKATLDFDGKIVHARMEDTFRMKGGKVNLSVGLDWKWAYTATNGINISLAPQYIALDPFPFAATPWPAPSADQLKEDPNIIPGSLVKVSTLGTPWSCDPL